MTTSSPGKGGEKIIKSVNDWNYKTMVLDNYNATKSVLVATAQSKFDKSMVQSCYLATSSLANMILPFVKINEYNITSKPIKERIDIILSELENDYPDVQAFNLSERAEFTLKCGQVINLLPPLFSYIGMYVKTTARGVFFYPDKEQKGDL